MPVFYFSKHIAKRNNRLILLILVINLPLLFCFGLVIDDFDIHSSFMLTTMTFFFAGAILFIEAMVMDRKHLKTKVLLDSFGVTRQCGEKRISFEWKDFSDLVVSRNRKGIIHSIMLRKNGKKLMRLHGLAEAEKFIEFFSNNKIANIQVSSKLYILDWDNTLQMICIFSAIALLFYTTLICGYLILF